MGQQVIIETEDKAVLKPLLRSAIENEKKMLALGLERTRRRLDDFEHRFGMTSDDFEHRLNTADLAETVEFTDWRMEIGMLRLLERQYRALDDARLD